MDSVPVCVMCIINCSISGVYVELSNVCSVTCLHSCVIHFKHQYHILQKHPSRQMRASLFLWFHKWQQWQHVCKTNAYVIDCICLTIMSKITVVRKNDWLLWMHTWLRWS
jgi:hypothetical protein